MYPFEHQYCENAVFNHTTTLSHLNFTDSSNSRNIPLCQCTLCSYRTLSPPTVSSTYRTTPDTYRIPSTPPTVSLNFQLPYPTQLIFRISSRSYILSTYRTPSIPSTVLLSTYRTPRHSSLHRVLARPLAARRASLHEDVL